MKKNFTIKYKKITRTCVYYNVTCKVYDDNDDSINDYDIVIKGERDNDEIKNIIEYSLPDELSLVKIKNIEKVEQIRVTTEDKYFDISTPIES